MGVSILASGPFEIVGLWDPAKGNFAAHVPAGHVVMCAKLEGLAAEPRAQCVHHVAYIFPAVAFARVARHGCE